MYLKADFQDRTTLIGAIRELRGDGFSSVDLDLFSDEPIELPRGVLDRRSRMSLTVVTGAVTLCLLTIGFVYFTQYNYPLVTGGMPLFSFWATGVIFYELTMLGGILTTLACFLWESGLLRRKRGAPVPLIEPGTFCLRVRCDANRMNDASSALERSGALRVGAIGDAL